MLLSHPNIDSIVKIARLISRYDIPYREFSGVRLFQKSEALYDFLSHMNDANNLHDILTYPISKYWNILVNIAIDIHEATRDHVAYKATTAKPYCGSINDIISSAYKTQNPIISRNYGVNSCIIAKCYAKDISISYELPIKHKDSCRDVLYSVKNHGMENISSVSCNDTDNIGHDFVREILRLGSIIPGVCDEFYIGLAEFMLHEYRFCIVNDNGIKLQYHSISDIDNNYHIMMRPRRFFNDFITKKCLFDIKYSMISGDVYDHAHQYTDTSSKQTSLSITHHKSYELKSYSISMIQDLLSNPSLFYVRNILRIKRSIVMPSTAFLLRESMKYRVRYPELNINSIVHDIIDQYDVRSHITKCDIEMMLNNLIREIPDDAVHFEHISCTIQGIEIRAELDHFIQSQDNTIELVHYGVIPTRTELITGMKPRVVLLVMMARKVLNYDIRKISIWNISRSEIKKHDVNNLDALVEIYEEKFILHIKEILRSDITTLYIEDLCALW